MVLIIDNYDSFTYNLVQYLGELGADLDVRRNDKISLEETRRLAPAKIVISPGPGRPESAGVSLELIRALGMTTPILGVCLGHQAIAVAYGGVVCRAHTPMHGKTSPVIHDGRGVFTGIEGPFEAGRYRPASCGRKSARSVPRTARLWRFDIASTRSMVCSFIPSPY